MELKNSLVYVKDLLENDIRIDDIDNLSSTTKKHIKIVVQALKKLQEQCKELIREKQELTSALLNSIPKDKIKDKIEELDVPENAEALEDIMNKQDYTITELIQLVLRDLLEEED